MSTVNRLSCGASGSTSDSTGDDDTGYDAGEAAQPGFFVLTGSAPAAVRLTDLDWTFVTTGLADAVAAARRHAEAESARAGTDLDVV
ncbi:hypothetical protein [Nocardioides ochotonae]|uniref:hypothetical protein n=1 Tax=Nocardioides ochotonae TaxID=2685869 RepID=UPI001A9F5BD6|nr:hypothetical protein [Nocardioides ochotonae]